MAVYLGSQKVGVTISPIKTDSSGKCIRGTATSDENGVVTFPALSFTPNLIAVWNISKQDLKEDMEAEDPEAEWDDSFIRYIYDGIMLFAIRQGTQWISQGLGAASGEMYITNASHRGGTEEAEAFHPYAPSGIVVDGNVYSYRLMRDVDLSADDVADMEFNYAIYG